MHTGCQPSPEVDAICLTCGCASPADDHGDPRNLTLAGLAAAADAAGITIIRAAANIRGTLPVPGPLPRLYADIDGTTAFQPEGTIIAVNARFGTAYTIADAATYPFRATLPPEQQAWERAHQPVLDVNLAPDTLAADVLRRAAAHGYPVTICTEREPGLGPVTRAWAAYWELPADQVAVVGPGGKRALLEPHGPADPAILIDDSPANEHLARPGVRVWVPRRPWTPGGDAPDGVWRFRSWNDAAAALGLT